MAASGEIVDVEIGTGGAFIRFRRATDEDRRNFDEWLANERDDLRELPEPIAADFKPPDHRAAVRWWLLQHVAGELLVDLSEGFRTDSAIVALATSLDAPIAETTTPREILRQLLTLPAIADAVEKAIGVSFESVLDFLAPQMRN